MKPSKDVIPGRADLCNYPGTKRDRRIIGHPPIQIYGKFTAKLELLSCKWLTLAVLSAVVGRVAPQGLDVEWSYSTMRQARR